MLARTKKCAAIHAYDPQGRSCDMLLANLTVSRGGFTIRDSPEMQSCRRAPRCLADAARHTECAYYLRLSHGRSQATTQQHAKPQAALA